MMRPKRRLYAAVAVVMCGSLAVLVGCGKTTPPTYPVGGKVVFADGSPLDAGTVEFRSVQSEKAVTARGQIQPDGSFRLSTYEPNDGAVEGECLALICPAPPRRIGAPGSDAVPFDLRFTQFETSGLRYTVTRDPTRNQFVVQVDRPQR